MSKKSRRKSKFKVPQKHKVKHQKLPKLIDSSKSVQERKERILEGELKSIKPFRQPEEVPEWEMELIDELDSQYFKIMNNFYNSIVPNKFKVSKNKKVFRETRTIGNFDIFHIVASVDNNMIGFIGGKDIVNYQTFHYLTYLVEDAINFHDNFNQMNLLRGVITPNMKSSKNKNKFYVLVEEEPSPEFFERDEITVNVNEEDFLNSVNIPPDIKKLVEENVGSNPVTIKVVNSVNHPETFFYYLQLKHIMRKIDQFGVYGM